LGTIGGLYKIKDGLVKEVLGFDGSHFGYVYTLSLDKNNRIWVGTLGKGLWMETDNEFYPYTNDLLTAFGNTYAIKTNEAGDTLVIQEDRIMVASKNLNFRLIIKENPVAGWSAVWLNETSIAIGSNNGIILVDIETSKITQRINSHLGKSAWQFTSTRSLYFDSSRKLYCGINSGLFVVDFKKFKDYLPYPQIHLESVKWENTAAEKRGDSYIVKPGKWSVNISVFTNWLIDEDQIRFRFKLIGFDENWSALTDIPEIRYNSLPMGQYHLQCQVFTPLTGYSSVNTLIYIRVSDSGMKFGFTTIANKLALFNEKFFSARIRNRLLRERNVELETEINERKMAENALVKSKEELRMLASRQEKIREDERLLMSREVHDELGQQLTGIKMGVAWLKKKIQQSGINMDENFDETLQMVDETTKTVRRISTELRPGILDSFGIIAALEWQAAEFEKRFELKIEFKTNCPDLHMDSDKSIAVFRIFQESLTNVFRYATASLVKVSVELENSSLLMRIQDNGIGFDESKIEDKKTLGILGMKERALMIGATYNISSILGEGTTTEVNVPSIILNKNT
jgi:signal transduction histidine kinase